MENTPPDSTPHSLPASSDTRLLEMVIAVTGGLTVHAAIRRFYGYKAKYYAEVSMADKLFIRRLAQRNVSRSRRSILEGSLIATPVYLETTWHDAVVERIEQLSIRKERLVSISEYVNGLIKADLRTIDNN